MAFDPLSLGVTLLGGLFSSNAASSASDAQSRADAARLAEEQRVRAQLRQDTEVQRAVADQAFQDYQNGLISQAEAQQRAGQAYAGIQQQVAKSQLSDVAKVQEMTKFQPYSIRTGSGSTFFDTKTGQAGFNLSPELQKMQQNAYGAAQNITGNLTTGLTPEQQAYQQQAYGGALSAMGAIATTPQAAAQQYMQQQLGLLQPGRAAEDIALRQQQLQRGRIGLGISGEAAGAGAGGMVNPEQFQRDRARALADAQIAAQSTQAGQQQAANQLSLAQGLFGQGAAGTTQQQQQLANQIAAGQGLYNIGVAPEQLGMNMMNAGMQYGQNFQNAAINQANLYNQGMANVYNSTLGAAGTLQNAANIVPQAYSTIGGENYQRQQTGLNTLQGNTLPYQAMTTPQATVPGSAYVGANLGNALMSAGINSMYNKPATTATTTATASPYIPSTQMTPVNYGLFTTP